jgi:sulfoxide reductase heme-binding subunit YedZ
MKPGGSRGKSCAAAGPEVLGMPLNSVLPDRGFFIPWRDGRGRLSRLRIAALAAMLLPMLWPIWDWLHDELGDLEEITDFTGRWALRFLLISLAVTPMGRVLEWPRLYQLRRMLGLGALGWVGLHVALYVVDQDGMLGKIVEEISRRFYLTIGFVAVLGLLLLGLTSTDGWVRYLGRGWKRLHRIVFPLAVLAVLHAMIQAKSNASEPLVMAGLLLWLVVWRLLPKPLALGVWLLAGAALLVGFATAGLEYLWYANATNLPAARIFMANFNLDLAPRPALAVMLVALILPMLVAVRRLAGRRHPA